MFFACTVSGSPKRHCLGKQTHGVCSLFGTFAGWGQLNDLGVLLQQRTAFVSGEAQTEVVRGKLFLNFDDEGFSPGIRRFFEEMFPEACRFERIRELVDEPHTTDPVEPKPASDVDVRRYPQILLKSRNDFPGHLNQLGLTAEGAEIGVLRGEFSVHLLRNWRGKRLHCIDPWRESIDEPRYVDRNNVAQSGHDHRPFADSAASVIACEFTASRLVMQRQSFQTTASTLFTSTIAITARHCWIIYKSVRAKSAPAEFSPAMTIWTASCHRAILRSNQRWIVGHTSTDWKSHAPEKRSGVRG